MKSVHGAFRRSPSWSGFLGFLTAIAALPFAAIHAVATEKSPASSPQEAGEHHAAPAVAPAAPAAVTGTANREKSAATVVVYRVDEVLAKIREDGLDETAARGLLEMWVKGAMSTASSLVPPPAVTQNVDPQRILWLKGRMVVQTIEAGHRQIRDTLDVIRKFGAAEIALEVRFVCLDEKEVKEMLPSGTISAVEAPDSVAADATSVQPAVFDRPLASYDGTQVTRAQYVVERDQPLRYRVVDKAEGQKLLARCQGDARSSVRQAPRVVVFNGQTARVTDTSQTPLVVGVKEVARMRQPQIRVVSEGKARQLRPVADLSGSIHLDFAATFSNIRKVETMTFGDASSGEVTIQVPEVATLRLEGGVALKSGQWLLLAGSKVETLAVQGEPAPSVWKDWLLGGGKSPKARPAQNLVLMLRAEKLPNTCPTPSRTENHTAKAGKAT
ncbi:MAG: hypothetical protein ACLP9L_24715 [Thermoguttaceae bacterium]